jgi:hypothetical protein
MVTSVKFSGSNSNNENTLLPTGETRIPLQKAATRNFQSFLGGKNEGAATEAKFKELIQKLIKTPESENASIEPDTLKEILELIVKEVRKNDLNINEVDTKLVSKFMAFEK